MPSSMSVPRGGGEGGAGPLAAPMPPPLTFVLISRVGIVVGGVLARYGTLLATCAGRELWHLLLDF